MFTLHRTVSRSREIKPFEKAIGDQDFLLENSALYRNSKKSYDVRISLFSIPVSPAFFRFCLSIPYIFMFKCKKFKRRNLCSNWRLEVRVQITENLSKMHRYSTDPGSGGRLVPLFFTNPFYLTILISSLLKKS